MLINIFAILLVVLAITMFLPFGKKKEENHKMLDLKTSTCLKGFLAIAIVVFHFFDHIYPKSDNWSIVNNFFMNLGGAVVGIFFMLSAYGLIVSYKKHGIAYLKKLFTRRIPILYLLFVLTNIFYVIYALTQGAGFSAANIILKSTGIDIYWNMSRANLFGWYIWTILNIYILFGVVFLIIELIKKIPQKYKALVASIILSTILIAINVLIRTNVIPLSHAYVTALGCFSFGLFYALFYECINKFLQNWWIWGIVFLVLITIATTDLFLKYIPYQSDLVSLLACAVVICIVVKFDIKSPIMYWLGGISLGIYITHGLAFNIISALPKDFWWAMLALIITVTLSIGTMFAEKGLNKLYDRKKKNE